MTERDDQKAECRKECTTLGTCDWYGCAKVKPPASPAEQLLNERAKRLIDRTEQSITNGANMQNYRKKNVQPMRPYIPGEDMTGISVNKEDTPELGGMIAVNPKNSEDRWYVAKQFFLDNYELAE